MVRTRDFTPAEIDQVEKIFRKVKNPTREDQPSDGEIYYALVNSYDEVTRRNIYSLVKEKVGADKSLWRGFKLQLSKFKASSDTDLGDIGYMDEAGRESDQGVPEGPADVEASGGGEEPDTPEFSDVPDYSDARWREIENIILDVAEDRHGIGPESLKYLKSEIAKVQHGVKGEVDLHYMVSDMSIGAEDLRQTAVPVLDRYEIPYTNPSGPVEEVEEAAEEVGEDVEEIVVEVLGGGGMAYSIGRFVGYSKYWIVVAVFLVSGFISLGTISGGLSEILTTRGVFWLFLFLASGFYWYSRMGLHLPLPSSVKDEKPSDELILGLELVLGIWIVILWIFGTLPFIGQIPMLGETLLSFQMSTLLLLLGLVGAYGLYHGEATVEGISQRARAAGSQVRIAGSKVRGAPRSASRKMSRGQNRDMEAAGGFFSRTDEEPGSLSGGPGAGEESIEDMVESARERAMDLHSEGRITEEEFESVETDITEAEGHIEHGRPSEAERKVGEAMERLNEFEGGGS